MISRPVHRPKQAVQHSRDLLRSRAADRSRRLRAGRRRDRPVRVGSAARHRCPTRCGRESPGRAAAHVPILQRCSTATTPPCAAGASPGQTGPRAASRVRPDRHLSPGTSLCATRGGLDESGQPWRSPVQKAYHRHFRGFNASRRTMLLSFCDAENDQRRQFLRRPWTPSYSSYLLPPTSTSCLLPPTSCR